MGTVLNFDYSKSSEEIVNDLIYHTNGIILDIGKVKFGDPTEYTIIPVDTLDDIVRNTKVSIQALGSSRRAFRGESIVFYRRLDLNWLESDYEPFDLNVTQIYSKELIPFLNLYYGLKLSENDILNELITKDDKPYKVKAHPNSLVWIGETKVNLRFADSLVTTNRLFGFRDIVTSMIGNKELSGFHTRHYKMLNTRYLDGF